MTVEQSTALPAGVKVTPLKTHPDDRGQLTEIFRNKWLDSPLPVQWIVNRTRANALRGMYVYSHRWGYLCTVKGEICVGLHDLRPASPTARRSAMIRLDDASLRMLAIPPGIAYGFYSFGDSVSVIGASEYHDSSDCRRWRWDDPELALDWPCTTPDASVSDGSHAALRDSASAVAFIG